MMIFVLLSKSTPVFEPIKAITTVTQNAITSAIRKLVKLSICLEYMLNY